MGFLASLRGLFASTPAPGALPPTDDLMIRAVDAPGMTAAMSSSLYRANRGPRKGSEEILEAYRENPWIRAAAHQVASSVARVPFRLYAKRDTASSRTDPHYISAPSLQRMRGDERRRALKRGIETGEVDEIESHPLLRLLERPNPRMSGFAARMVSCIHYDLIGEWAWILDENEMGMPVRAWPIPPTWIKSIPTAKDPHFEVSFEGFTGRIPAHLMLWARDADPGDPYARGAGMGLAMADEIDIDEHAAKMGAAFFQNHGMPTAIVSMKGANQAAVNRARSQWDKALKGFKNAYQTYFTGAELSVARLDTSFKDMALVEIRKNQRDLFVTMFGVPPEKVGILANSNRATIDAADLIEAKNTMMPRLEQMRTELQWRLVIRYDPRLILDFDSPIPGDREFKKAVYAVHPKFYKIDEHRALTDDPPLPNGDGDAFLVPNGDSYVKTLAEVGKFTPPQPFGFGGPPQLSPPSTEPPAPTMPTKPEEPTDAEDVDVETERSIGPRARGLSRSQARDILAALNPDAIKTTSEPVLRALVDAFGAETMAAISETQTFNAQAIVVDDHLRDFATERIAMLNATTHGELRAALASWDGENDDDLVDGVADVFRRARIERSQTIAATEGVRSSNFATHQAMKQSGVVQRKEWVAVADGRTRESHLDMDGQTVDIDMPFRVVSGPNTGAQSQAPGGFAIAGEDINCRCLVAPTFDVDTGAPDTERALAIKNTRASYWDKRDRMLRRWEAKLGDAFSDGFDAQEAAVLAAVRKILA